MSQRLPGQSDAGAILEHLPDGIALVRADDTIVWSNGRLAEWCGKASLNTDIEKARLIKHIHTVRPNICDFHLFECDDDIPGMIFNLFRNLQRIVIIRNKSRTGLTATQTAPQTPTGIHHSK
jgi:hypothetical protein